MSGSTSTAVLIGPTTRIIGTILPTVTIEEEAHDDLRLTNNPVELGAAITDHAFKEPAELTMRVGWSNSDPGAYDEYYVRAVYEAMLALQASCVPLAVTTGKRVYQNMLITRLSMSNNAVTEYSLILTVSMRQVLLVSVTSTTLPPVAAQAIPQQTAPTTTPGQQQVKPAPNISILRDKTDATGVTTPDAPPARVFPF